MSAPLNRDGLMEASGGEPERYLAMVAEMERGERGPGLDVERLVWATIAACDRAGWSVYRTGDGGASWVDRREVARQIGVEYEALTAKLRTHSKNVESPTP